MENSAKTIELFTKQIERLEKEMEKVTKFGAKKADVKDQIDMVRMMMENTDNRLSVVKKKLEQTDTYIDRYLPCRVLNMIKDLTEESFSDYNDNKNFLTKLRKQFEEVKVQIDENEFWLKNVVKTGTAYSGKNRPKKLKELDKTKYHIPEFDIPPTLSLEEEEEEAEQDEDSSEFSSKIKNTGVKGEHVDFLDLRSYDINPTKKKLRTAMSILLEEKLKEIEDNTPIEEKDI